MKGRFLTVMSGLVASVLFIVVVRSEAVSSIAHTAKQGLSERQDVRKPLFEF
jgi:hypothetical protein